MALYTKIALGLLIVSYVSLFVWFVMRIRIIAEHVPDRLSRKDADSHHGDTPHNSLWH